MMPGVPVLNAAAVDALSSGHLAHLVTLEPDGSPQVSLVWTGVEGTAEDDDLQIVSGHLGAWRKVENVRRDPRVALSLETGGTGPDGLAEYLVVHGRAYVSEGGAPALLQELAHVYLGPSVTFPPMEDPPPGVVLHVVPERVGGVGPWTAP